MTASVHGPLRVGIGAPVGSGKTALMEQICKRFHATYDIAAITKDIYTTEDACMPWRDRCAGGRTDHGRGDRRLPAYRHSRGRLNEPRRHCDDATSVSGTRSRADRIGRDNLVATFSPELADITISVIDVSGGEKIPRKGGPGIIRSNLLVI